MEKRKPHYKLSEMQALVADPASQPLHSDSPTKRARFGPDGIGDATGGVKAFPTRFLQGDDFARGPSGVAGCVPRDDGRWDSCLIKITGFAGGRPPVIQFKAK